MNDLDDVRFDRLVDGELSRDEYRRLLESLDGEPDGWKRCATAFLEAQAWGQEFRTIREQAPSSAVEPKSHHGPAWTSHLLSIAASFLLAFALSSYWWDSHSRPSAAPAPASDGPSVAKTKEPAGSVQLIYDSGDGAVRALDVPAWDGQDLNNDPVVPSHIMQDFERMGHEVRREQLYLPFEFDDGRPGVLPVEEFQILPGGTYKRFQ